MTDREFWDESIPIPDGIFLSASIVDRNSDTRRLSGQESSPEKYYKLIRYKSDVDMTVQVQPDIDLKADGVIVEAYNGNIKNNGSVENGSIPFVESDNRITVTWLTPKEPDFTVRVRYKGFWYRTTVITDMINYVKPTCVIEDAGYDKENESTKIKISGKWFNRRTTGSTYDFYSENNIKKFQYRKREVNGTWSDWYPPDNQTWTPNGFTVNVYDYTGNYGFYKPPTKTMEYQFRLTDKLYSVDSNILLAKGKPIFDWDLDDVHFGVNVNMDKNLEVNGGTYLWGGLHTYEIDLGATGDIIRNGQSIFSNTSPFRATNNFSATKAISDNNVIGETNNISITAHSPTWTNSNLSNGDSHNFTFYIIQPLNLVLLRGYVSGFNSDLANSTSYINLCKFDADFGAADISALSVSGPKPCSAIMNTDGYIKIIVPEGVSTGTQLYITGIYPLNNNSSYYKS